MEPPTDKSEITYVDDDANAEHIMQFFDYAHLPANLQDISKPFQEMALWVVYRLPRNPERSVALRKLLEAKDAAVRAFKAGESKL